MKSIIQSEKRCFVSGDCRYLHEHHIFGGARRKLSERYGLKVWLRADWHNMADYGVHFDHALDLQLKQTGQRAFERDHSREEFIRIFGQNYLDDDAERQEEKPAFGADAFVLTEPEELPYE